jgi:hypothetical protein
VLRPVGEPKAQYPDVELYAAINVRCVEDDVRQTPWPGPGVTRGVGANIGTDLKHSSLGIDAPQPVASGRAVERSWRDDDRHAVVLEVLGGFIDIGRLVDSEADVIDPVRRGAVQLEDVVLWAGSPKERVVHGLMAMVIDRLEEPLIDVKRSRGVKRRRPEADPAEPSQFEGMTRGSQDTSFYRPVKLRAKIL